MDGVEGKKSLRSSLRSLRVVVFVYLRLSRVPYNDEEREEVRMTREETGKGGSARERGVRTSN